MKINEIKFGMRNVNTEGKIVEISGIREVSTRYGRKNVASATIKDDTGEIALTLWENQIDSVSVGDQVKVSGAYVTEFKDQLQLNVPRSGKIEVVNKP